MVKNKVELKKGIVLFDGECNFCDASVQYMIKYDKKTIFVLHHNKLQLEKK